MRTIIPLPVLLSIILLGLVLLFILRLWLKRFRDRKEWLLFLAGSAPGFALCILLGPWAFMSIHLRWVFLLLYIIAAIISYRKTGTSKRGRTSKRFIFKRIFFSLLFGAGIFFYFKSSTYEPEPVPLSFPLKNGKYYVMQGGSNFISNPFHLSHYLMSLQFGKDIRYAMDIARLNYWGNRAASIYSKELTDYTIYNDTVYAPCAGKVVLVRDGIKDNEPGHMYLKEAYGNYIIIQGKDYRVILAHLEKGSITVKEGDRVVPGRPIARQGNSGRSIEPHLHLDAVRNFKEDDFDSGKSAPITFDGNFYTINDIIRSR